MLIVSFLFYIIEEIIIFPSDYLNCLCSLLKKPQLCDNLNGTTLKSCINDTYVFNVVFCKFPNKHSSTN